MIAITVDHADYALRLGQAADAVIESDDATASGASLPTPQQAIDALEAALAEADPEVHAAVQNELKRQRSNI